MNLTAYLAELKRRKVLRVAAVYGATAFCIMQVADIVFPSLGLPQWAITLVVALALIGFPMAVALAWTFDASGDGLRRTPPAQRGELEALLAQPRAQPWRAGLAALFGVLLLAGGTAWTLGERGGGRAADYDSIAVLPFTNMSGDSGYDYFGDGLAEELLNALAGIEGLKVAARTSAFAFKDTRSNVRVIGDTLGVATVLEGSVRRSADRIRIAAQLIDVRTGYHLWSQTYDRPLTELFEVQDAITREIVGALAARFTRKGELYRGGTADVAAYDMYMMGRQKWATRRVPLLREAVQHFEQAIARDSSFALAWSGLADAINALAWRVPGERARVPEGVHAAQRAIVLEPELAEGWASVGVMATDFGRDRRFAELALRRAIKLKPSYSAAHYWLSDLLRYAGRTEESLESSKRAFELDPLAGMALNAHIEALTMLGRLDEARGVAERMRSQGFSSSYLRLLEAAQSLGFSADHTAEIARAWAEAFGYSRPDHVALIGRALIDPALRPQARQLLALAANEMHGRALSAFSMGLGDYDGALAYLERALEMNDPTLVGIGVLPTYDPLRKDPRFIRIVEELGLPNGRS